LPASSQLLQLPAPDEIVETEQMQKQVNEVVELLPTREKQIIKYRMASMMAINIRWRKQRGSLVSQESE